MVTPVRRQYLDLKARHPDAILLFRLGDFYETFDEDAKVVSEALDIALTSKPMGGGLRSPLAGVPVRSVEQHLSRLVAQGHRVAICAPLEPPVAGTWAKQTGTAGTITSNTDVPLELTALVSRFSASPARNWRQRQAGR